MFLRVLKVIDEEIVEFDERRSKAEVLHNTLIKVKPAFSVPTVYAHACTRARRTR